MITDLSTIKEAQIVLVDKATAIRYKVVEEKIDLEALRTEKANLEAQLEMKEPSDEELIEIGKRYHPYFTIRQFNEQRLFELDAILGVK